MLCEGHAVNATQRGDFKHALEGGGEEAARKDGELGRDRGQSVAQDYSAWAAQHGWPLHCCCCCCCHCWPLPTTPRPSCPQAVPALSPRQMALLQMGGPTPTFAAGYSGSTTVVESTLA